MIPPVGAELLCAPMPQLFTDARKDDVARLRGICARCTVLQSCRAYSLAHDVAGFAGGMTARERRRARRDAGLPDFADIDRVAIERRLRGDHTVRLSAAELEAALRIGAERLGSVWAAGEALGMSGTRVARMVGGRGGDEVMRPVRERAAAALADAS